MRKKAIKNMAAAIGLAGWATLASAGLFSATGPVIAILGDELFVGVAEGRIDGSGSVAIRSQKDPDLTCAGQFVSNADKSGSGQLNCNDGSSATFQFKRLSVLRGYGTGSTSRGSMSFAYGLSAEEATPYLTLPKGTTLRQNGDQLEIAEL